MSTSRPSVRASFREKLVVATILFLGMLALFGLGFVAGVPEDFALAGALILGITAPTVWFSLPSFSNAVFEDEKEWQVLLDSHDELWATLSSLKVLEIRATQAGSTSRFQSLFVAQAGIGSDSTRYCIALEKADV